MAIGSRRSCNCRCLLILLILLILQARVCWRTYEVIFPYTNVLRFTNKIKYKIRLKQQMTSWTIIQRKEINLKQDARTTVDYTGEVDNIHIKPILKTKKKSQCLCAATILYIRKTSAARHCHHKSLIESSIIRND